MTMDEDHSLLLHKCDGRSPISQTGVDRIRADEPSPHRNARKWAHSPLGVDSGYSKYLRAVTEADGETVYNAFFDRRFRP